METKKIIRWSAIAAVILISFFALNLLTDDTRGYRKVETSVALQQLSEGKVEEAQIDDREQRLRLKLREGIEVDGKADTKEIIAQYPARATDDIFTAVRDAKGMDKYSTKVTQENFLMSMLGLMLPMLIFFALIMWLFSRMQGGAGGGMFGIGGSRAKQLSKDMPKTTFADVAGADEAVSELAEIRDFLQNPEHYERLGAKIPRGVLLYGPPGTGKTLLARAVAGEAGVPFFTISGSDFVEMFVGVGASRVRDLFKQAKESSPCIIFIDEIDAVGRQRGAGMGGGHDEREQTLNQLLVEMDGFDDRSNVILMAATNRPDVLDPALLRPGRFDRQIPVTNPDMAGRRAILKVHAKNKPLAADADLDGLAKRTAGMSGADLQNVLNEAALLTARVHGNVITADALEEAVDRVIGGPRRTSKIISEQEKKVTAYHEGGHTLAAWALKDIERVYKVTILARGRTGGHAMTVPEDDKGMYNRAELFARLVFAMGGRAAEELIFGQPTTGASADIEQATKIARGMVAEYGMSPHLGTVKYGEEDGDPFLGRGGGATSDYSPKVAAVIDEQIRYLIDRAHREAYDILKENRDTLDILAAELLEKETLRRPDLEVMFKNVVPRRRVDLYLGLEEYPKDFKEPVLTPVEQAIARGEEPPKKVDFIEAIRKQNLSSLPHSGVETRPDSGDRESHSSDKDVQSGGTGAGVTGDDMSSGEQIGEPKAGRPRQPEQQQTPRTPQTPQYGGTPPPPNWTAPGWPPADSSTSEKGPVVPPIEEQRGFQLPANEKPSNPWEIDNDGK